MSEPQHPQPHETDTNEGHPAPVARAVVQPAVQPALDSLAAVGARLHQLRESKGWTIEDVSARLKVSAAKLTALEAGDISHLPDTTFALGVVRSYAKMLDADPAPFTAALRREKGVPAPNLSMPASSGKDLPRGKVSLTLGDSGHKRRSWLWGIAAIVVAVIALGMWRTNGGDSSAWLARLKASASGAASSDTGASGALAQAPATPAQDGASAADAAAAANNSTTADEAASAAATPMPTPLATGTTAGSASADAIPPAAPKAASQAAVAGASAPAAVAGASAPAVMAGPGQATIALRVTQDSWFSVRGKDGKELFSGLVHAGDAKEVSGEAPFKVTVGNKAGLESVTLDGQPIDPAKYSAAKGNVARFSLP